ncbi:MAG: N-acetylmuramoyl-L-alanine amidase [Clostridium sp.]|nr:N-acetylmuramoyl-L-alanine amidase [Clostridium sp.]MCM1548269.1 N-acetylmuramoyl-L-alanine amidase [Ruminococcus sp.]
MAKKVFIGVGHGGSDSGAVKYIVEKEYTLKTAMAAAEYLKEYGVEYKLSRTADIDTDMNSKVKMCNDYNPDLVADVHFNAGGGEGFEVYRSIVGGVSKTLAENIESQVKKLMKSRGVKTKLGSDGSDYFAIIRETKAPAVLLEGGFVDSSTDSEFIKSNYKKLAKAYADGIAQTLGVVKDPDKPDAKVLDKSGYKKGDSTIGVLSMKELLLIAKKLGINKYGVNKDGVFGDGTQKSVNYLLESWGYSQNGIAGSNFIKKLHSEIDERMK